MRTPLFVLGLSGLLGACGDNAGAILVLSAPEGPATAARIEIVLANAADDTIAREISQRIETASIDEAPVTYYRQRATGGSAMQVEVLDGFSVQIEPELAVATEDAFIPFLLVRDAQGDVIAVGSVDNEDGSPFPIDVTTDQRIEYTTTIRPIANPAAKHGLRAVGRTVTCGANPGDRFASGIVWRPERGPELRLLLAEPGETDATERALDLDCDQVAADAPERDCDDVDASTYSGAAEMCDGVDTNCDGVEPRIVQCDLVQPILCNQTNTTRGIQTCDTTNGEPRPSMCVAGPDCPCAGGLCNQHQCTLGTASISSSSFSTCSPAASSMQLCGEAVCTVTIESVDPNLELAIGATPLGPFGTEVTGTKIYLKLQDLISSHPLTLANQSRYLGAAVLSIDDPASSTIRTYVLGFNASDEPGCTSTPSGGGSFAMVCVP